MRFVAVVTLMGATAGTESSNAGSMISVGAGGAATGGHCEGGHDSRGVAAPLVVPAGVGTVRVPRSALARGHCRLLAEWMPRGRRVLIPWRRLPGLVKRVCVRCVFVRPGGKR